MFRTKEHEEVYQWICNHAGDYIQRLFGRFKKCDNIENIVKELKNDNFIYIRYEMEMGGDSFEHAYPVTLNWIWVNYRRGTITPAHIFSRIYH